MKKAKLNFTYIGAINSSAKIAKGEKIGVNTFVIYLSPSNLSGWNTCSMATKECILGCLNHAGNPVYAKGKERARFERTKLFYENRSLFMDKLVKEITTAKKRTENENKIFAIRLNGTSDLSPLLFTHIGKNLLELFPDVNFYDYTKVLNRSKLLDKYKNYHLTFSFAGNNWDEYANLLNEKRNVSVIFNLKKSEPLPKKFNGYKVIDGDITDYRLADKKGTIVGLRWKRNNDKAIDQQIRFSKFVQQVN